MAGISFVVYLDIEVTLIYALANILIFISNCFFLLKLTKTPAKFSHYILFTAFGFINIFAGMLVYKYTNIYIPDLLYAILIFAFTLFIIKFSATQAIFISLLFASTNYIAMGIANPIYGIVLKSEYSFTEYSITMLILHLVCCIIAFAILFLISKLISINKTVKEKYIYIPLCSIILLGIFTLIINRLEMHTGTITSIADTVTLEWSQTLEDDISICVLSLLKFTAILAALISYKELCKHHQQQIQIELLNQQIHAQHIYLSEAKTHLDKTMSLKHDFNNHLNVLNNLLSKKQYDDAQKYLDSFESAVTDLSLQFATNNTVIDTLLNSKLNGIDNIECQIVIPTDTTIDNFDLCVILSNAIDNAIAECSKLSENQRYIKLSSAKNENFFVLTIQNSCRKEIHYPISYGIGLNNICSVAEKYNGTVNTEVNSKEHYFKLSVLMIL